MDVATLVPSPAALRGRLDEVGYLADDGLATALFCAVRLPQPLLLEGEAGVGKTEAAKALAAVLDTPLMRLQCYDGIDAAEALYEWNYPRQLLSIRVAEARGAELSGIDICPELLAIARERTPGADLREGDLAALPFVARSFDVVTGANAFQFAPGNG